MTANYMHDKDARGSVISSNSPSMLATRCCHSKQSNKCWRVARAICIFRSLVRSQTLAIVRLDKFTFHWLVKIWISYRNDVHWEFSSMTKLVPWLTLRTQSFVFWSPDWWRLSLLQPLTPLGVRWLPIMQLWSEELVTKGGTDKITLENWDYHPATWERRRMWWQRVYKPNNVRKRIRRATDCEDLASHQSFSDCFVNYCVRSAFDVCSA